MADFFKQWLKWKLVTFSTPIKIPILNQNLWVKSAKIWLSIFKLFLIPFSLSGCFSGSCSHTCNCSYSHQFIQPTITYKDPQKSLSSSCIAAIKGMLTQTNITQETKYTRSMPQWLYKPFFIVFQFSKNHRIQFHRSVQVWFDCW